MTTVLTLNMMHWNCDLNKLVSYLNDNPIDIGLFQEGTGVRWWPWAKRNNSIRWLGNQLGGDTSTVNMNCYSPFWCWNLGIFSKHTLGPCTEREFITGDSWRRSVLVGEVSSTVRVATTHLGYDADDQAYQVEQLLAYLDEFPPTAITIVGGDFNCTPDHAAVQRMLQAGFIDAWAAVGVGEEGTFPKTGKRIDYLFIKGAAPITCGVVGITVSDHYAVRMTF